MEIIKQQSLMLHQKLKERRIIPVAKVELVCLLGQLLLEVLTKQKGEEPWIK